MKRYLYSQILSDLKTKMVFITGPRQVGKTFIAKQIAEEFSNPQYLNFDNIEDRRIINNMSWRYDADLLIFDEIHNKKDWKIFLKGVYDSRPQEQRILVTGSARLDTFRQSGESLAGRYLHLRMNPISVKEITSEVKPFDALEKLNNYGGFPEPFLFAVNNPESDARHFAARWRNQYYTDLIREDIVDFSRIQEIKAIRLLLEMLRTKVGSPISYKALSEDLQLSPNTVKKYVSILESLYIIFLVRPFHKNVARAILKEPKVYFYDTSFVEGDEGVKLENTVSVSLLKEVQFQHDAYGENISLNYLRTKENKEIDFVIVKENKPARFIEVKLSDNKLASPLIYFAKRFPNAEFIQLVHNLRREETIKGVNILRASDWLNNLTV